MIVMKAARAALSRTHECCFLFVTDVCLRGSGWNVRRRKRRRRRRRHALLGRSGHKLRLEATGWKCFWCAKSGRCSLVPIDAAAI